MRSLEDFRRVVMGLGSIIIMVEDQTHGVFQVLEFARLHVFDLIIVNASLFH